MNFIDLVNHMSDNNEKNLQSLKGKKFRPLKLDEARLALNEGRRVFADLNKKLTLVEDHFQLDEMVNQEATFITEMSMEDHAFLVKRVTELQKGGATKGSILRQLSPEFNKDQILRVCTQLGMDESIEIDEKKLQEKDMIYASKMVDMLVRQGKPDSMINQILAGALTQSEIISLIASSRKQFGIKNTDEVPAEVALSMNDNPEDEDQMDVDDFGLDEGKVSCEQCHGKGKTNDKETCEECSGTGKVSENKKLEDEYNSLTTSPEEQSKNWKRIKEIEKTLAKSEKSKKVKESTESEMVFVGTQAGLDNNKAQIFAKFMLQRFPRVFANDPYATEWAERFKNGTAWTQADNATKQALTNAGLIREGMELDTVLDESQMDMIGNYMNRFGSDRSVKEDFGDNAPEFGVGSSVKDEMEKLVQYISQLEKEGYQRDAILRNFKPEVQQKLERYLAQVAQQPTFPDVAAEVDESLLDMLKKVRLEEGKKDDEVMSNKKKLASILRKIHKATDDSDIDQALDLLMKHYITKDANVEAVRLIQAEAERKRNRLSKGDKVETPEAETDAMIDKEVTEEVDEESLSGEPMSPEVETPTVDDEAPLEAPEGEQEPMQEVNKKILVGSRVKVGDKEAIVAEIKDGTYKLLSIEDRQPMYNDAKDNDSFTQDEIGEVILESKLDEASRYDAALKQLAIGLADDIGSYMHTPGDEISNSGEIEQAISDYAESWIPELASMVSQILKRKGFKVVESKVNESDLIKVDSRLAVQAFKNGKKVYWKHHDERLVQINLLSELDEVLDNPAQDDTLYIEEAKVNEADQTIKQTGKELKASQNVVPDWMAKLEDDKVYSVVKRSTPFGTFVLGVTSDDSVKEDFTNNDDLQHHVLIPKPDGTYELWLTDETGMEMKQMVKVMTAEDCDKEFGEHWDMMIYTEEEEGPYNGKQQTPDLNPSGEMTTDVDGNVTGPDSTKSTLEAKDGKATCYVCGKEMNKEDLYNTPDGYACEDHRFTHKKNESKSTMEAKLMEKFGLKEADTRSEKQILKQNAISWIEDRVENNEPLMFNSFVEFMVAGLGFAAETVRCLKPTMVKGYTKMKSDTKQMNKLLPYNEKKHIDLAKVLEMAKEKK